MIDPLSGEGVHLGNRVVPSAAFVAATVVLALALTGVAQASAPPRVLVVHSYHRGFTWTDEQMSGILAAFRQRWATFAPHTVHLDAKRHEGERHDAALLALLRERRPERPWDAVIATDDAALAFVLRHRAEVAGEAPIAFSGVNGLDPARAGLAPRLSGVIEDVDVAGTLSLIRALQPALREVVVLVDETDTSTALAARVRAELSALPSPAAARVAAGLSMAEAEALVAGLGPDDAVLLGSFVRDREGVFHAYEEVAARISARSRAPVYGLWEFQLGRGIVGGSLLSGERQGRRAAEIAMALAEGRDEPVDRSAAALRAVDVGAAERFGLRTEGLDAGVTRVNAPRTIWNTYWRELALAAAVFAALLALSATLLVVNRRLAHAVAARRRAEAERLQLRQRLDEGQRIEAIGRLAGGIAHDLNNLLTPILACAALAREQLEPGHPAAEDLETIAASAGRARDLTRQVLAFSRRQRLELRVVDLGAEVRALHAMLVRVVGPAVQLRLSLAARALPVEVDAAQLQQVLMNLVVNARDAVPRGGTIEIATGERPPNLAFLHVRDTGAGMTEETKRHLFEPFFTTKPTGQGTGLGLSTVHGIVKQHGGEVEVESAEGRGSTFRVVLPLAAATDPGGPPASPPEAASAVPSRGEDGSARARRASRPAAGGASSTILLVEDEPLVRQAARRVLAAAGYAVVEAQGAASALAAAEGLGRVDLLLTDVVMPGLTGPELAERLATARPGLRVLYMSGYPAQPGGEGALPDRAGEALLQKPFTPEELLARVAAALPPAVSAAGAAPSPR